MIIRKRLIAVVACVAAVPWGQAAGATTEPVGSEPTNTDGAAASSSAISLLVIGDSIPFNAPQDCQGCVSFADGYGAAIETTSGQPVVVSNRSRHDGARIADIAEQVASGQLTELLNSADIVIISAGYNDQPPYDGDRPCAATSFATDQDLFEAVTATTTECVDEVTETIRESAANLLADVREQAPDAAVGVLTAYDSWSGWDALDAAGPETADAVHDVIAYGLDQWRTALCAEAEAAGAICIDIYDAFNGPDGDEPSGPLLAADYTHPSQLGNDRIRDLLVASELYHDPGDTGSTTTEN